MLGLRIPLTSMAVIGVSVRGRGAPPALTGSQPTQPVLPASSSNSIQRQLVGDGRVDLYAGFCARRVPRGVCAGGGHPSRPAVAGRLQRPTRRHRAGSPQASAPGRHLAVTPLLGLAPGGVYRATPVTRGAGGLLPHRFTLTVPVGVGGLFSVALSRGSPRVAVNNHPALWSPDVPRRRAEARRRGRPVDSSVALPS